MSGDTSAIKAAVEEYLRACKELTENAKQMGIIRRHKNELGELILNYLHANDVEKIRSSAVTIIKKDSKRTETLTKDLIKDVLQKHGLDADKILRDLQSARKTSVKQVISVKAAK